jgi:small-conductance mechanosensitive channel
MARTMNILNLELWRLGDSSVTISSMLTAVAIFIGALAVAWLFKRFIERVRKHSKAAGAPAIYLAGQAGRYLIVFIGVLLAGSAMGINLSSLSLFAGALGVGIGLGVQDIFKDFIAGLVLLFDRSIEVGDFIELENGAAGEIRSVGARATTLITNDNVAVLIPNSMLLRDRLTNWTRNRATRRIHVPFSVAYGSDKTKVRAAAIEAASAVPFTLPDSADRRSQVWLAGFGESALEFELVVWPTLEAVKRPGSMMAAYRWAIDDALQRHGLEIPFPQQDVRVRSFFGSEGEEGLKAWRGERKATPSERKPKRLAGSINDAAVEISRKQDEQDSLDREAAIRETAEIAREAARAETEPDAKDRRR